jgi:single-strand DNA-binding protein
MIKSNNFIHLTGRLGKTPEMQTSGETQYCRIDLAVNSYVNKEEKTFWFQCVAFGKLAKAICDYCSKGDKISVMGTLTQRKKEEVTYYSVLADSVEFHILAKSSEMGGESGKGKKSDSQEDDLPF